MMFIVGISLLSLKLRSIVTHVHKCVRTHTPGQFPGVEGVRRGMCSLALLECSKCDEKRGAAAFPMQTPRHTQPAPLDRGHGPVTPSSSREIVQVCFLSRCLPHHTPGACTMWEPGVWKRKWTEESDISPESETLSFLSACHCLSQPSPGCASSSSFPWINSVNWSALSVLHWLWPLIKQILIGSLFNIGLRTAHCPLMLFLQQPFPVSSTS